MTDYTDHVKFAQHNLLSLLLKGPISPLFCGTNDQSHSWERIEVRSSLFDYEKLDFLNQVFIDY